MKNKMKRENKIKSTINNLDIIDATRLVCDNNK